MTIDRPTAARSRLAACTATALALVLCACGQENRYVVAPPPPKVTVAMPVQQKVTRYLEATGNNTVEQGKVMIGPRVGDLRVIESGLKADDRIVVAGILRAIPGQKVDPQLETAAATPAPGAGGK